MIHDHKSLAAATPPKTPGAGYRASSGIDRAYRGQDADRVRRFLPMVRRLAWHVHGSGRSEIELDDLMQAGLVALTEAAQNHTGPSEDGFAAYAKMRVRGAMIDLLRRSLPQSRGAGERRRMIATKEDALRGELGRNPTESELAAALGVSNDELASLRAASEPLRFVNIDDAYNDADGAFADERPDSLALLEDQEMRQTLAEAVAALPERLQVVIQLYFVEELNLSEIAAVLDVSVPRVHQLKAQALDKLKAFAAGRFDFV